MTPFDWRAHLKAHPAADLFPLMSETDPQALRELAKDIKERGLKSPILLWESEDHILYVIDGRNRLDALALLGWLKPQRSRKHRENRADYDRLVQRSPFQIDHATGDRDYDRRLRYETCPDDEVAALIISLNVRRRHLTADEKRDLIAKLLKQKPETSNRQVGETVSADHKTVGAVRAELVSTGEIPQLEKTIGADGKARKKPIPWQKRINSHLNYEASRRGITVSDLIRGQSAGESAGKRKAEYAASETVNVTVTDEPKEDIQVVHVTVTPQTNNEAEPPQRTITETNQFNREIGDFIRDFEPRFRSWFESSSLTDDARASLHNMLMQAANTMMNLAQEVDGRGAVDKAAA